MGRRCIEAALFFLTWFCVAALLARDARAEDFPVPVSLQAELLAKVVTYDKNFAGRANGRVKIIVLAKADVADSERFAAQMRAALGQLGPIGGLPHEESVVQWSGGPALAALVRSSSTSIVYVSPAFLEEIETIRTSLDGVDVLSVSAVPAYVPRGIVLGFDLASGKPKLLVHLRTARQQHVDFKSEVLKIMRVFE